MIGTVVWLLTVLVFTSVHVAKAQQPARVRRIGFVASATPSVVSHRIEAFQQGLRELGYIEGKNIVIESRYAEGKLDQLPALVAELVALKVEILVSGGPIPTRAAKRATATIPIVMTQDTDPVGQRVCRQPGATGRKHYRIVYSHPGAKRKTAGAFEGDYSQALPHGGFWDLEHAGPRAIVKRDRACRGAVQGPGSIPRRSRSQDIEAAFRDAIRERVDAVLTLNSPIFSSHQLQLAELAVRNRLPIMYNRPDYVEAGGLMTYGVNLLDLDRRAATYVDKILKGAKPADLPVEQPTKFELVVNLKTAKQLGLTIPPMCWRERTG
jgi:putative tryptophan/tyrosine transport system substrate-binding protein